MYIRYRMNMKSFLNISQKISWSVSHVNMLLFHREKSFFPCKNELFIEKYKS